MSLKFQQKVKIDAKMRITLSCCIVFGFFTFSMIRPVMSTTIRYPASVTDMIADYFRDYKHIRRLTLFLCVDDAPSMTSMLSTAYKIERNTVSLSQYSNFQQIGKRLMVSGNFLINGDGNIDGKKFEGNDVNVTTVNISDMLKCDDFKRGVVLDLRCRHANFIFQQVKCEDSCEEKHWTKRRKNCNTPLALLKFILPCHGQLLSSSPSLNVSSTGIAKSTHPI